MTFAAMHTALAASALGSDMVYQRLDGSEITGRCVVRQQRFEMVDGTVERRKAVSFCTDVVADPKRGEKITIDSVIWDVDGAPVDEDEFWIEVPVRRAFP